MYNPQLDTFVQVAESGSFSAAANALYITPTAVIKQMNLLEARLGLTLFNRTHRGLTLTKAGESLLVDVRHIIRYSNESVERARMAERGERQVVRVGVSPMTPATQLTRLWQQVRRRLPSMAIQMVTFENTPYNARHVLGTLGQDIDVVAGVFDDGFLRERGCCGLPIARSPICVAVPVESELAQLERMSFDDLHDHALMLIRRGWNEDTDLMRDDIWRNHPQIEVRDFPQYRLDVFNECAGEGAALAVFSYMEGVHPMLVTIPGTWDYAVTYGIMYAPEPSEHVERFIETVRQVLDEEHRIEGRQPEGA